MLHTSANILSIIHQALAEDQSYADVTTDAIIPPSMVGNASMVSKSHGVLAGIEIALAVFHTLDSTLVCKALAEDGTAIAPGDTLAHIYGSVGSILKGERTALNFLQRMSGIATETAKYVQAVSGLSTRIVDTRKTAPGLRHIDKYAVRAGGGHNHRHTLSDGILVKDTHLAALVSSGLPLANIVRLARRNSPHTLKIGVEVETIEQAKEALDSGADFILLDNMDIQTMCLIVSLAHGRVLTEASGGINLETVRAVAETGVDVISVGALTHSVKALDIGLEVATSQQQGA